MRELISVDLPTPLGPETVTDFPSMYSFNFVKPIFFSVEIGKTGNSSPKFSFILFKNSSKVFFSTKSIFEIINIAGIFCQEAFNNIF